MRIEPCGSLEGYDGELAGIFEQDLGLVRNRFAHDVHLAGESRRPSLDRKNNKRYDLDQLPSIAFDSTIEPVEVDAATLDQTREIRHAGWSSAIGQGAALSPP